MYGEDEVLSERSVPALSVKETVRALRRPVKPAYAEAVNLGESNDAKIPSALHGGL